MTDGEKMIWASVFALEYKTHADAFRCDMRGKAIDIQRREWCERGAAIAASMATQALADARAIKTSDIDEAVCEAMSAVFDL